MPDTPSPSHYFAALVLGDNLASRLAATLLARQGVRTLHCLSQETVGPAWLPSSPLLEQLLQQLDARSCLRPARPVQIISANSRVEIHGSVPLQDELRREFPQGHARLIHLLQRLEDLATSICAFLQKSGGYPLSLGQQLRAPLNFWRNTPGNRNWNRPLADSLGDTFTAEENRFLQTLFVGMSQLPWEMISLAEAALVWVQLISDQEAYPSVLEDLLAKRFSDAGGAVLAVKGDLRLESPGGGSHVLHAEGRTYQVGRVIFAPPFENLLGTPPPEKLSGQGHLTIETGKISPLLASRILLAAPGGSALRIQLFRRETDPPSLVDIPPGMPLEEPTDLTATLESIFPFATLKFSSTASPQLPSSPKGSLGLRRRTLRAAGNDLWSSHAQELFPGLCGMGECLVGMSLARYLGVKKK